MITVTEAAAVKIQQLMTKEGVKDANAGLRITVAPGGCAGYMYEMRFDQASPKADEVVHQNGVTIITDKTSAQFLKGSIVDYIESLQGAGFKIDNPNVQHSCHCGKSVA
jgi:iron-sulfur cluster assembly protein